MNKSTSSGNLSLPLQLSTTLSQFIYWHSRSGDGFYKFLQPCRHKQYRKGDSWCEELGVSEKTFRKHAKCICTPYASEQDFLSTEDPFQGKPFACFHDRGERKTFYYGNAGLIAGFKKRFLPQLGKKHASYIPIASVSAPPLSCKNPLTNQQNPLGKRRRSTKNFRANSESPLYNTKHSYLPPKSPTEKNAHLTTPLKKPKREGEDLKISLEKMEIAKKMVSLWTAKTEIPVPPLSPRFAKKLLEVLTEHFQESMEAWSAYCDSVGSSRFLTGKVTPFHAWLVWAIRADIIKKIKEGLYGVIKKFVMPVRQALHKTADVLKRIQQGGFSKGKVSVFFCGGFRGKITMFSVI